MPVTKSTLKYINHVDICRLIFAFVLLVKMGERSTSCRNMKCNAFAGFLVKEDNSWKPRR